MTFQITVEPSGRSFSTDNEETILLAAIRQGIGLPYGCKDGACGSCKCRLVSGEVRMDDHQAKALSTEEAAAGLVLTCRAHPLSDVTLESKQVTAAHALPVRKMPARVAQLERLAPDVMRMRLQLPAAEAFAYHAGQYVEFILRDGARRSYSMANAAHTQADTGGIELHIRHMPGGKFTDSVFTDLKEKAILRLEGPFGSFYLREDSDAPMIFLASGTGFAPIKALLEHMQLMGTTRATTVYWGARRPQDLYLHAWMEATAASMANVSYIPVVSDALAQDEWTGRTGFVHRAVMDDFADLSAHQVYACGAPIVVDSAREEFTRLRGLNADAFYADAFTSAADGS
jgi:CDP-4-dehydro-6-deoxyglucose reductase, E3